MQNAYPNARLIHLPIHASWLNQIEIYFSILQRKALTPNDFADLDALAARITAFEEHYRQIAQPFDWTRCRSAFTCVAPASSLLCSMLPPGSVISYGPIEASPTKDRLVVVRMVQRILSYMGVRSLWRRALFRQTVSYTQLWK